MGEPYRADYRGPVFHFFWPLTRYVTVHVTVLLLGILFYVLNRATVLGRRNVPRRRNTLLLSNHQTGGPAPLPDPLESGCGGELLSEPVLGVVGGQLEVHTREGGAA